MLTLTRNWAQSILAQGRSQSQPVFTHRIAPGGVLALPRDGRRLRVVEGEAWLTMKGRDHFLAPGQSLELTKGREKALISGLYDRPACIQLS